jgi:thioredoxin reductase
MKNKHFEVIIIGGSYAGLAAAMTLGRSLRKTLVIDSSEPCNRFTPHSHNFLTQDGNTPKQITTIARQQVEAYRTVEFQNDYVTDAKKLDDGFEVRTKSGNVFEADKLIFATGIKDIIPGIKGLADCWGKSIIHCPYCHGYEFHHRKTAIWVTPENVWHLAPLVRNLTPDLTLLTNGGIEFTDKELARLDKHDIKIIDAEIAEIAANNGELQHVIFADGSQANFDALYVSLPFEQHCPIPAALGCELTDKGYIKTDTFFKTTVEGVYACGDNASPFRSVANAIANGNFTGAGINRELAIAEF